MHYVLVTCCQTLFGCLENLTFKVNLVPMQNILSLDWAVGMQFGIIAVSKCFFWIRILAMGARWRRCRRLKTLPLGSDLWCLVYVNADFMKAFSYRRIFRFFFFDCFVIGKFADLDSGKSWKIINSVGLRLWIWCFI